MIKYALKTLSKFTAGFLIAGSISAAASAQITVTETSQSRVYDLTSGNNTPNDPAFRFTVYLNEHGFNDLITAVNLTFEDDGFVEFELVGSEPGRDVGTAFYAIASLFEFEEVVRIGNRRVDPRQGTTGYPVGSPFDVEAGDTGSGFYFLRLNSAGIATWASSLRSVNAGVIVPDASSLSGLESVLFAFEDLVWNRWDFDDLVIRATFVPNSVPEPGTLLMLLIGILGTALLSRKL